MARKAGVNMSEEIRQVLKANPSMKAKEVVAALAEKGIKAKEGLVYYIKGKVQGRKSRRKKASKLVAKVAVTTGSADALATILKVKHLASEVGGYKKLKALVEALSE
jgi:histidyl-tRNA synthetase